MSEIPRVLSENFLGGNFSKNRRMDLGPEVENQGEFSLGEFVLVEMPKFEISGMDQLKKRTREARKSELAIFRERIVSRESIFGETFKDRARNQAVSEIIRDYPRLDLAKISFYLKLIQNGLADDWDFGGGLIAIEKAEPWSRADSQCRLTKRTKMTFEDALNLISENREQILKKIVPESESRERVDLSKVELGIPTMEELIFLEAYHPEIISLNRGKAINRWTSTKVKLGGTDEENNLIWASESGCQGDFFSMDPKEADIRVGFDIVARFK